MKDLEVNPSKDQHQYMYQDELGLNCFNLARSTDIKQVKGTKDFVFNIQVFMIF